MAVQEDHASLKSDVAELAWLVLRAAIALTSDAIEPAWLVLVAA